MNVLVIESQNSFDESINLKKSNYIICPKCKDNALFSIKDFNLNISGCKSEHRTENLELKELEKSQYIDQSKIFCDICHTSKSDTDENKFFLCIKCKQKLCPNCEPKHDGSHKDYIKDYEENQFYCPIHYDEYTCFCNDCKKDLCNLCQKDHEKHKLITYDSIMPDLDILLTEELKDTREYINKLKMTINGMIYQLNNLNKNLDIYFDIYYNIVSNLDKKKRNYFLIKNVNNIKLFNNNFIGNLTEITCDNNMKSQFTNIINIQSKIDFKKIIKNDKVVQIETKNDENEITTNDNNEIIANDDNGNINNNINSVNDNNLGDLNTLDNNYENFNVNKIKQLQSFNTKFEVHKLLALKDGRIITNQIYYDENYKSLYKLSVYSLKNQFICDINKEFEEIDEFYQMDDEKVIMFFEDSIKIFKINKNDIDEIWSFEKKVRNMEKISKDIFLIKAGKKGVKVDYEVELYKYDKSQLIFYKNIKKIYKDEHVI